jgi:hypothetical protein
MVPLRSSQRDPICEHLNYEGGQVVDLVFRLADRWLMWRRTDNKITLMRAPNSGMPTHAKLGKKMLKRLPKLAFICITFAFAAASYLGAQGARDVSTQWTWCSEQPSLTALQGLQEGTDLEPHQAAVLAACTEQAARDRSGPPTLEMAAATDF